MFSVAIPRTPLVDGDGFADKFFRDKVTYNGQGYQYQSDVTFVSTLRALLYPRMGDGQYIDFMYLISTPSQAGRYMSQMSDRQFWVVNLQDSNITDDEWEALTIALPINGFKKVPLIGKFFSGKKMRALCLVNDSLKSTMLVIDKLSLKRWHYLQCAILPAVPWYYTDNKVSEREKALIESLTKEDASEYLAILQEYADEFDFKGKFLKEKLGGFETIIDKQNIQIIEKEIVNTERQIDSFYRNIQDCEYSNQERNLRLKGLKEKLMKDSEGDGELLKYFLQARSVDLIEAYNGMVKYRVKGCFSDFADDELRAKEIKNPQSHFYYDVSKDRVHGISRLLTEVFITRKYQIRTCSEWFFNIITGSWGPKNHASFSIDYESYYPNPHLQYYTCYGGYRDALNQSITNGDYVGFIETSIGSNGSLNFYDGTVMGAFVRDIVSNYNDKPVVINQETGELMSFHDAIREICENDKKESDNNGEENKG